MFVFQVNKGKIVLIQFPLFNKLSLNRHQDTEKRLT